MRSHLEISLDSLSRFRRVAEFGFNTCHAGTVMRSDVQAQMERSHRELGMRYWRCHGTLSDGIGILDRDRPTRDFTFSGLKRVLDAGLRAGVRPFFELSFMPSVLARDPSQTITQYRGVTSPPKQFGAWGKLISALMGFLEETYGVTELRKWYFEVWNEPNIPFWQGTRDEYFELYRRAALAIKKADAKLRVGGPATARGDWVTEFLSFGQTSRTPIDFLSTHIYPSDVAFVDSAIGEVELLGAGFLHSHFRRVRREVDALRPGLPIIWGEWNSSAGPLAKNHDDCNNAALVCAALAGMEDYAEGSLFWNLTDIYEECQFHFAPFHGGYGLYTVDDIPKSAARAFEFWRSLKGGRARIEGLPGTPARSAFATYEAETRETSILLWNHREPGTSPAPWRVSIQASPLRKTATVTAILPSQGSAHEAWLAMKEPLNLSPAQLLRLQKASVPRTSSLSFGQTGKIELLLPPGTVQRVVF